MSMAFKIVYIWNKPVAQKVEEHSKPVISTVVINLNFNSQSSNILTEKFGYYWNVTKRCITVNILLSPQICCV